MFTQTVSNQKYLKRFVIGAAGVELSERWLWHSGVLSSTGNDKGAVVWHVGLLSFAPKGTRMKPSRLDKIAESGPD